MKKRIICLLLPVALIICAGCGEGENIITGTETQTAAQTETSAVTSASEKETTATQTETETSSEAETTSETETARKTAPLNTVKIAPDKSIRDLTASFSYAAFSGDDGLDDFISGKGVSDDEELTNFLIRQVIGGKAGPLFKFRGAGCSTLYTPGKNGTGYFGRNFDWKKCNGLALVCRPSKGYKSVSTVNLDFITSSSEYELSDDVMRFCALYAPLDGMNEKGVCVSVNMVFDKGASINQQTSKPDLTTTTAVRLILDRAGSAKQAVELLKGYDMHASFGYVIHFAICDPSGYSAAVEYINNKIYVTETPALTNFYVTPGSKYGVGSQKSVKRYENIMKALEENGKPDAAQLRDIMADAAQGGLNDYNTEWTAVSDMGAKAVTYYLRENYKKGYTIYL